MTVQDPFDVITALKRELQQVKAEKQVLESALCESRLREEKLTMALRREKSLGKDAGKPHHIVDALQELVPGAFTVAATESATVHVVNKTDAPPGEHLNFNDRYRDAQWQPLFPDGNTPVPPEQLPPNRSLRTGEGICNEELILRHAENGRTVHLLCHAAPIRDPGGAITGAVAVWRDIGGIKAADRKLRFIQKRLKRNEMALRLAIESTGLGTFNYYPVTGQLDCSLLAKAHFGLPPDASMDYTVFLAGLHPDDRNRVNEAIQTLLKPKASKADYAAEYRTIGIEDQKLRWIAARGRVFSDKHGRAVRFIGTTLDITERKRAENAKYRLASIVESSEVAIVSLTLNGIVLTWNRGAEKLYGYTAAEAVGAAHTLLNAPGHPNPFPMHSEKIARGAYVEPYETVRMTRDGRNIHVLTALSPIRDDRNAISGISSITYDITARKKAEAALKAVNEKLNNTLNSITDGYLKLGREWEFLEMNPVAQKIFGRAEDVIGKVCWQRYPQAVGSEFYRQVHAAVSQKRPVHFESRSVISGKWYETHAYPRSDGIEIYFRDISDRKTFEEEIKHLAYHDLLTGLPNKTLLMDLLRIEMAHARRNRRQIAVLFLDLDGFKDINDRFGHAAGDLLLKEVAERLKRRMRGADIVSRVGGDEFNVILPNISDTADAATISRKLIEDLNQPFTIYANRLKMTSSIGISVFPDDSEDMDTLCRYADIAMYQAKQRGRNNYQFHNPSLNSKNIGRIRREFRLKQALAHDELVLFYQPQRLPEPRDTGCAEALLRWRHPEDGLLPPDRFLSLAEETGMIVPIGQMVLHTVCRQGRKWQTAGHPRICLAVNLSDREFREPGLINGIRRTLQETGFDPQLLELEIAESTAMRDIDQTLSISRQLGDIGIRLSLDDFGTGHSCLSHLIRLPLHKVKIDRSVIRQMDANPRYGAIIDAAMAMADKLDFLAVAEGVETEAEMNLLRRKNCAGYQGHFLSEPLPADRFEERILRTRKLWEPSHVVA